ncbi:hypothetical protein Hanom_Chr16g01423911 [Helianthus anomalus]
MDFGLAFLRLCLSFYTYPFPTLPSYLFQLHNAERRARERKRRFGRNIPLISILVSGIGESGDADEVQLVVVLSYKFAGKC